MESNPKKVALKARKKCVAMARSLLKMPLQFAQPLEGLQTPEASYYTFTLITVLSTPPVSIAKLPGSVPTLVLPVLWNYLDGACCISVGFNQLLDEDNYRQDHMLAKGLLNIISGLQLYLLSYNPALIAALGITGAPAGLAGIAFALSTLIDVITASIDFIAAKREKTITSWFEERQKEYAFIEQRIQTLEEEMSIIGIDDAKEQAVITNLQMKVAQLRLRKNKLEEDISVRAKIHKDALLPEQKKFIEKINPTFLNEPATELELQREQTIQNELENNYQISKKALMLKLTSFIGMSLIAVATFALFTACPGSVAIVGFAITVVVAATYLYRHREILGKKFGSFFKKAEPEKQDHVDNIDPELNQGC